VCPSVMFVVDAYVCFYSDCSAALTAAMFLCIILGRSCWFVVALKAAALVLYTSFCMFVCGRFYAAVLNVLWLSKFVCSLKISFAQLSRVFNI